MKTFVEKIKSRKFLAAVAGVVTGLAMVFGLDDSISLLSQAPSPLSPVLCRTLLQRAKSMKQLLTRLRMPLRPAKKPKRN